MGIFNRGRTNAPRFNKKKRMGRNYSNEDELTMRQRAFCREYVKDYNGLQAAIRAGYSENGSGVIACNLLKQQKIYRVIERLEKNLDTRFVNSKERVLKEMALIAHSDISDYLTPEGDIRIKDLRDLPPQVSRAIKKIRVHTRTRRLAKKSEEGGAGDEIIEQHIDFELYDKPGALDKMGKELGLFKDRTELTGKDGLPLIPPASTVIVYDFGEPEREDDNATK